MRAEEVGVAASRVAAANLASVKSQVDRARINLRYATITSPIDGRVSRAEITEGNLVGVTQTVNLPYGNALVVPGTAMARSMELILAPAIETLLAEFRAEVERLTAAPDVAAAGHGDREHVVGREPQPEQPEPGPVPVAPAGRSYSMKVTDDVYLARVYTAALEIFRGRAWRSGIDGKLKIIRETYGMLNDEAQAARSELLEATIVLLIVAIGATLAAFGALLSR